MIVYIFQTTIVLISKKKQSKNKISKKMFQYEVSLDQLQIDSFFTFFVLFSFILIVGKLKS